MIYPTQVSTNQTPFECLKMLFLQLCIMDHLGFLRLRIVENIQPKILGENNETVVWSAACPISDLFCKVEKILCFT